MATGVTPVPADIIIVSSSTQPGQAGVPTQMPAMTNPLPSLDGVLAWVKANPIPAAVLAFVGLKVFGGTRRRGGLF